MNIHQAINKKNYDQQWAKLKIFAQVVLPRYRALYKDWSERNSLSGFFPEKQAKADEELWEIKCSLEPYLTRITQAGGWLCQNAINWVQRDDETLECIFFGVCKLIKEPNQSLFKAYTKSASSVREEAAEWVEINPKNLKPHELFLLDNFKMNHGFMRENPLDDWIVELHKNKNSHILLALSVLEGFGLYGAVGSGDLEKILVNSISDNEFLTEPDNLNKVVCGREEALWIYGVLKTLANSSSGKLIHMSSATNSRVNGELFSAFSRFLDETALKYYFKHNSSFLIKSYFDYIEKHESDFDAYEAWWSDNPNKVALLIANNCNQEQLNNKDIFAYKNILNKDNPIGGFETKPQFRKLMALPTELLDRYFLLMRCAIAENTKPTFKKEHFQIFVKWISLCQFDFSEPQQTCEGFDMAVKTIPTLMPFVDEVQFEKIAYALDLTARVQCSVSGIRGKWAAERRLVGFALVDEISDFIANKDAFERDYNISRLTSKTTIKSAQKLAKAWHKDLQTVDFEKLKINKDAYIEYKYPTLKRYEVDGVVFEPICSNVELMELGIKLDNCLYSFNQDIQDGVFSVFKGEHKGVLYAASFEILGTIRLDECRGHGNSDVTVDVLQAAEKLADIMQAEQMKAFNPIS